MSAGSPLPRYSPTQTKQLANSVGRAIGGPQNFGILYDHYIDSAYADVKANGTPAQKRYMDQHASSRNQASAFGESLGQLLDDITDDSHESQMKTAVALVKLKLAPVIVCDFSFGRDNHNDFDLSVESNDTLSTLGALSTYWAAAKELDVVDDTLYATSTVFGRDTKRGGKGGRGHEGELCTGLVIGAH